MEALYGFVSGNETISGRAEERVLHVEELVGLDAATRVNAKQHRKRDFERIILKNIVILI